MMATVVLSVALMTAGTLSARFLDRATKPQEDARGQDILRHVDDLGRMDLREDAAKAILATHAKLIERLIEVAARPGQAIHTAGMPEPAYPWHEPKHLAILLLGDLRASAAVPTLLENLTYMNPRDLHHGMLDRIGQYPAVESLSKIGMPAVDPTLEKLSTVDPKSRSAELCCWIVREILGVKLARARVQIAIEETRDATAKENLKAALPFFRTPQEKAAEERARESKQGQK
jgi:hypothetical protein